MRKQLAARGVELHLGTVLREEPSTEPGVLGAFTTSTESGVELEADLWFRCFGVTPVTDYLGAELAAARNPNGFLEVTPELRLAGQERVFVVGDLADRPEEKKGGEALRHAEFVSGNIRALIDGAGLRAYDPYPPGIQLPLGPDGGASQMPGQAAIAGAQATAEMKGIHFHVSRFAELLGLPGHT